MTISSNTSCIYAVNSQMPTKIEQDWNYMLTELMNFFDYCIDIESSYERHWFIDDPQWSPARIALFSYGVICGLYKEKDQRLLSLMNACFENGELYQLTCKEVDRNNSFAREMFAKAGIDQEKAPQQDHPEPQQNPLEWHRKHNSQIIEMLSEENADSICSFLYIYYSYKEYRSNKRTSSEREQPHINEIYACETNSDFLNWNLVPVQEGTRELKPYTPPRIFDTQKSITIIVDLPKCFVDVLVDLQKCGKIGSLSVRCKDNEVYNGICERQALCEEVEQGRVFSLNIASLPNITKLYDSNRYHDQLWVKKTDTDLTFEELCDDFSIESDSIATRMLHISHNGDTISHIDYERIFYTPEEYERRILKMDIKGSARKRQKYFKINDAIIPFDFPCKVLTNSNAKSTETGVPFILFVLNCFFTHKTLIDEYFKNIC